MSQINCPNCGNENANEYFYYISCNKCNYEEVIKEDPLDEEY